MDYILALLKYFGWGIPPPNLYRNLVNYKSAKFLTYDMECNIICSSIRIYLGFRLYHLLGMQFNKNEDNFVPTSMKVAIGILWEIGKTDILQFILQEGWHGFWSSNICHLPCLCLSQTSIESESSATTDPNFLTNIWLIEYLPALSSYLLLCCISRLA